MRSFVVALWLAVSLPAQAATLRALGLEELVARSDMVVRGEVTQADSFWQGTRIYTLSRVRIDETWATNTAPRQLVDVVTLGGVVGDIGQRVDGVVTPPLGEQVVLMLQGQSTGEHMPVSMGQGIFVIEAGIMVRRPGQDRLLGRQRMAPPPQTLEGLKRAVLESWHAKRR